MERDDDIVKRRNYIATKTYSTYCRHVSAKNAFYKKTYKNQRCPMFKIFENPIRIMRFYLKSVNVKEPYFWFVLGWGGGLPVYLLAWYDSLSSPPPPETARTKKRAIPIDQILNSVTPTALSDDILRTKKMLFWTNGDDWNHKKSFKYYKIPLESCYFI